MVVRVEFLRADPLPGLVPRCSRLDAPRREGEAPQAKRHWGLVNYPVEDVGLGMSSLRIEFAPPSRLASRLTPSMTAGRNHHRGDWSAT